MNRRERFDYIAAKLWEDATLDDLLAEFPILAIRADCLIATTWINQDQITVVHAWRMLEEIKDRYPLEEYPELWI